MIVRLTADAETDPERIGDHIAQDSPARALAFIQELRACCDQLRDMPTRFRLCSDMNEAASEDAFTVAI